MRRGRYKKTGSVTAKLIAPCGMNCRLCRAFVRQKNSCPGCREDDERKPKTRVICKIKTCEKISRGKIKYCSSCSDFPCAALRHLDKRYRTKYSMSMIDNLMKIKQAGIRGFVKREKEKWACPKCGELICVHKEGCIFCGYKWRLPYVTGS